MNLKQKILIAIGLVTVGVVGRLVPHLWNMTPVAGVAILAGYKMGWKWGVVIPVFSMFLGDIIIGFYSLPILLSVYISLILTGLLGNLVSKYRGVSKIFGVTIFSTILFFVFTNAMVWAYGTMYPHNFLGLMSSYVAGLPFFQNQLLGDLFFTATLFVIWEMGKLLVERFKLDQLKIKKVVF